MRTGSAPNFAPPVEEGAVFTFEDESGVEVALEFLGLLLFNETRYGFFFPISDDAPALSSGEIVVLQVTELDSEGQPTSFEMIDDEATALAVYEEFKKAAKDLYDFE